MNDDGQDIYNMIRRVTVIDNMRKRKSFADSTDRNLVLRNRVVIRKKLEEVLEMSVICRWEVLHCIFTFSFR